ncbi:ABC transporter ATP-binding protein [Pseudomonas matsuisoli]|uniref:ABC transporter ATP-binding protein n=1 Tax=Pseudomonas matsuisoli TaxID=1515666 RepID=A0A917PQ07_9PSED|nr:ABC transporter ATP-binding protein [Pseudomonas matsuisoli]GGJ86936.1 ABC transporter ATP-binding protein [Pseudomonas matsuisoli]
MNRTLDVRMLIGMAPWSLGSAALLACLSALASLVPFYCLYRIASELFVPTPNIAEIQGWVAWAVLAVLLRWALMAASHSLAHLGAFDVIHRLRLCIAERLAHASPRFHAARGSGELRKVVMDDVGSLEGLLAHLLPDAAAALCTPLFAFALLLTMDWRLGLAALAPLPVALLLQAWMMRGGRQRMVDWQAMQARLSAQWAEYLRGMPVVKAFGLHARSFGKLESNVLALASWVEHHAARLSVGWAWFTALLSANLILIAPLGVWLHGRGEVDAATVVLFLLVAPIVLQPLLRLTFALGEQQRRQVALERIDALLQAPPMNTPQHAVAPAATTLHAVTFDNVHLAYDGQAALRGVSFTAPAGQVTALVGASGSGKSSLLRLVSRLEEADVGEVRVAGKDVREWPQDALLQRLGTVLQEVFLFHGSVADNLRRARPDATDAELAAAARAARADGFISALPQGYDTPLGERGAGLSGGERQRLTLARALLRDTPILLLDEATAHADAENDRLIHESLLQACQGRTLLMVAHRLYSVRHADHIVVLDAGKVVGQGRHEELLASCPTYRKSWEDQQAAADWQLARG